MCVFAVEASSEETTGNGKKRKKAKGQEIQEETALRSDLAKEMDLSCMGRSLVRAPTIDNGYVLKYNR